MSAKKVIQMFSAVTLKTSDFH